METLIFSANAVLPIILLTFLGWTLKKVRIFSDEFLRVGNKLTFKVLLPTLLFYNVYNISDFSEINWTFVLYGIAAVLVIFVLAMGTVMLFTKDNARRGVLIQAIFRSNYAIVGIPLATLLCGQEGAAAASVLSAFSVPLYNILAVVCLSIFHGATDDIQISRGTSPAKNGAKAKKVLLGIVTNPLILGVAAGLAVLGIRSLFVSVGISLRLSDIGFLYTSVKYIANATTPFALLVLGGQFEFSAVKKLWKSVVFGTVMRTVAVPVVALLCAYLFVPNLSGEHFASYVALFGTPVAVSSAIMANEMGGDGELAGQLVVWTTAVSAFTLFAIVVVCRAVGIF